MFKKSGITFTVILCFVSLFSSQVNGMIIKYIGTKKTTLYLDGKIKQGDFAAILKTLKKKDFPREININSKGGNVYEAIKIGIYFRSMFARIISSRQCYSACFIIWSGGYDRSASLIGLHRPTFESKYFSSLSAKQASESYKEVEIKIRNYLSKMDISTEVADLMFSVDSINMHLIDAVDLNKYITRYPYALNEWFIAKCGSLSAKEESDRVSILVEKRFKKLELTPDTNITSSTSAGYQDYVKNKAIKVYECRQTIIKSERIKLQKKS